MNIIILGYRASGKSSVGRRVADLLGCPFLDTDALVREHFEDLTIATIWQRHGEPAFRAAERDITLALLKTPHSPSDPVIALGGGTPLIPEITAALSDPTIPTWKIYLSAPANVLAERLAHDADSAAQRPSLTQDQNATTEIAHVLQQRDPTYRRVANLILNVAELDIEQAAQAILTTLPPLQPTLTRPSE